MKIDKIEEYIKNPSLLGKKDFAELTRLIEDYPYFQTAHMLLVGAAKNSDEKDFDEIIAKSSAFISNRQMLYILVNKGQEELPKKKESVVTNKNIDNIKSVTKIEETKNEEIKKEQPEDIQSIINSAIEKVENKTMPIPESEKLTEKGKNVHSSLLNDIMIPIVESEKTGKPLLKEAKPKEESKLETIVESIKPAETVVKKEENAIIVAEKKSEEKVKPVSGEKDETKNILSEMKTSAEVIDHIISEKLTEKPKLEEPKEFVKENKTIIEDTKTVIEEPKKVVREPRVITNQHENKVEIEKFEIKRDNNISTKSITDDIFDKIANLKIDKSKTNIIDGKTNGVRKDDIFKTKREPIISKKSEPDINLNSESEIVIIKEDSKVDSAEIKEIKKRDIVTNLESINERIEKEEKLKKEEIILEEKTIIETKLDNSDEEKPLELPDKEEVEFIKKVIAEIKGEPKSEAKPKEEIKPEVIVDKIEVEKVIEKLEKVSEIKEEIKISISKEKPVDIIINNEKDLAKIKEKEEKDAADSVFNKIAEFKKRRTAGKQEKEELVEKFIQTEPRLDRTKEIDIKGDVSKESTKEKQPVVTELMANIFINQGHYDKAIDIFEKLILKNPEKKDYFASKIAETQKLRK